MSSLVRSEIKKILISLLFVGIATFIQWFLTPVIGEPSFIIFFPLVILSSLYGNGGIAILISALIIQIFFLPPQDHFFKKELPGLIKLILFMTSSLMIHSLTTILKQTLAQAQKMEARLQVTLNSIGDAVISTDREGRVDYLNPVAESMTGWSWGDALGKPITEVLRVFDPLDQSALELPIQATLKGQSEIKVQSQILLRSKKGKEMIIEDSLTPIRSVEGRLAPRSSGSQGLVLVFRDVSEKYFRQKELDQVLRSLQESREQFEKVLENVLDGAVITDQNQRVMFWNPQAEKMFGYTQGEALTRTLEELLNPIFKKGISSFQIQNEERLISSEILRSLESKRGELEALRKDHSRIPLEVVFTPVQGSMGVCSFFFFRDLSLAKKAERDLLESHQKIELILSSTAEGIIGLDHEGRIMFVNPAAAQMLGWEQVSLIGQMLSKNVHDFSFHIPSESQETRKPRYLRILREPVNKASTLSGDFSQQKIGQCPIDQTLKLGLISHREDEEFRRRDGSRFPVEYSSIPMKEGEIVMGLVLTFRDISERKKTEAKVAELMKKLREALSSRDEFISIASHELKTPLTSLKLQYQLVARQLALGDTQSLNPALALSRVENTNRQIDRMVRLIDDMLDVSRISSGHLDLIFEDVNLSLLLRNLVERYTEDFKTAQCILSLELEDSLYCRCDALRVEQVVVNLLMNALKYAAGKPIEIRLKQEGEWAVIQVQDHGMGISEEKQRRVFEKFERAISSHYISGLGLGLYISKKIVEAHHGEIMLQSELGRGSCFTVKLSRKRINELPQTSRDEAQNQA